MAEAYQFGHAPQAMPPKRPWRAFLVGFVGAVTALLVAVLLWVFYLTYVRALQGAAAFDYLQRQLATQVKPGPPAPLSTNPPKREP